MPESLCICYFGTYRANYVRNQLMIERLRRCGMEVIECHEQLWYGIEDRVKAVQGQWLKPIFLWRVLRTYTKLLLRYGTIGRYDILIVGYPGHFDVFLARLLTWLRGKPLVWDVLMSIYLIALERGLDEHSWISRATLSAIRAIEHLACQLPDVLLIDTLEYVDWFHGTHNVPRGKFRLVPLGANDRLFKPIGDIDTQNTVESGDDEHFYAVYYGSFVPAHGTRYIIEAAHLLAKDKTIHFELIGKGGEREKAMQLARDYGLSNVSFPGFVDDNELIRRLNHADICLASFGITPQSLITIHNKVFEVLAMAQPLIIGDAPAIRRHFKHGEHLYFCERENAQSLANAISILRKNTELREAIARKGHDHYRRHFTVEQIGAQIEQYLFEVNQNGAPHTVKVRR